MKLPRVIANPVDVAEPVGRGRGGRRRKRPRPASATALAQRASISSSRSSSVGPRRTITIDAPRPCQQDPGVSTPARAQSAGRAAGSAGRRDSSARLRNDGTGRICVPAAQVATDVAAQQRMSMGSPPTTGSRQSREARRDVVEVSLPPLSVQAGHRRPRSRRRRPPRPSARACRPAERPAAQRGSVSGP